MAGTTAANDAELIELATELTAAWLGNPNVTASSSDAFAFLTAIHAALGRLGEPEAEEHIPAVPVRNSVKRDHLISLIDGNPYKTLKRHLSRHGLTPEDYRQRYGLKADYPMVAPSYAEQRSTLAKSMGLGRRERQAKPAPVPAARPRLTLKLAPGAQADTGDTNI